jgi:hypothetical protein
MSNPTDEMHKLARAQTDPLFFHHFMAQHDVNTKNATATFVQFKGRVYVCTCRHVVEILKKRKESKNFIFPVLGLIVDRNMLDLSFTSAGELQSSDNGPLDIAIADITGVCWDTLVLKKNKRAIDLDNWREPRWSSAAILIAAGYPDEHKHPIIDASGEKVGSPLMLVAAEVDGKINKEQREVHMRSRLPEPHAYYFSGMSGGPMYVQQDELLVPVGILCEGWPAISNYPVHFDPASTTVLLDGRDIIVRGLTLTPSSFEDWLGAAGVKM